MHIMEVLGIMLPYHLQFQAGINLFKLIFKFRFGTPDDFKLLVDRAHENDLYVLLDIVHR